MPRLTAATPAARRAKFGKAPSGPSIDGRVIPGWIVRSTGTSAPSTEKSSEPLPRRPAAYHVSWNVTSPQSKKQRRKVPSSQFTPPTIHRQCWVPLPHCHRPVTRNPSPSASPAPLGANTPPATVAGSPNSSFAVRGGRNRPIDDVVEAIIVHQPAAPSDRDTASMTSTSVRGSASGPP